MLGVGSFSCWIRGGIRGMIQIVRVNVRSWGGLGKLLDRRNNSINRSITLAIMMRFPSALLFPAIRLLISSLGI
jgi:hypothetical protein